MLFLLYHPLPKLSISHGGVGDAGWTSVRGRRASFIELSRSANFLIKLDSEARRNLIDSEFRSSWIIYTYMSLYNKLWTKSFSLFLSLAGNVYTIALRSTCFRYCCIYFGSGFESAPDLSCMNFLYFYFSFPFSLESFSLRRCSARNVSHEIFMATVCRYILSDQCLERITIFPWGFISSLKLLAADN